MASISRALPMVRSTPDRDPEWWVEPLRWAALWIWLAIPVFALLVQPLAGRVVWTVAVASLPLFIVLVGYHRWRRICPLALFNQIPTLLRRPGTRRVPAWLEERYYYVPLSLFVFGLWLRLNATNGDGMAIAAFFVLLSLAALAFGLLFTGKTWCQYVCPVSFIEKIYTEPHGLRETRNSQCAKCTACKKACPDINQENGYWKEIGSSPKRFAYFAYPGLVFGFYFYYFLQSGTWDYYFGGDWTDEPGLIATAFLPGYDEATAGFFFLPIVPRALASLLTLGACALASLLLFSRLEPLVRRWLRGREPSTDDLRARHVMFTLAGFAAFVTFYAFAGQPTLRKLPWLPTYTGILVVVTATVFLVRRLKRSQEGFAEEALARNIIKQWEWDDVQPPKSLHDAYLVHMSRSREREREYRQILEAYRAAVRESLASGFITRADVQRLEALRGQLGIKRADHEKIMATLAEEERSLLSDPVRQVSPEKRLQLEAYRRALQRYMDQMLTADRPPDGGSFVRLRSEYGVTEEEHAVVLDGIFGGARGRAMQATEEIRLIDATAQAIAFLRLAPSPTHELLIDLLAGRRARALDRLMPIVHLADEQLAEAVRAGLASDERARRRSAVELLRANVPPETSEHLLPIEREVAGDDAEPTTLLGALRAVAASANPYARATALLALFEHGAADKATLTRLRSDEHGLVREAAEVLTRRIGPPSDGTDDPGRLTAVEKIVSLRSVPAFASLEPESLAELAWSSTEATYLQGEALCREGEPGDEVFILLSGEVEARRRIGGIDFVVGEDSAGGIIGEMAVLDPAPRAATVVARSDTVRVLRLNGDAFRRALHADPSVADGVIRTLARRLRVGQQGRLEPVGTR